LSAHISVLLRLLDAYEINKLLEAAETRFLRAVARYRLADRKAQLNVTRITYAYVDIDNKITGRTREMAWTSHYTERGLLAEESTDPQTPCKTESRLSTTNMRPAILKFHVWCRKRPSQRRTQRIIERIHSQSKYSRTRL
jgi:hypothetical protein